MIELNIKTRGQPVAAVAVAEKAIPGIMRRVYSAAAGAAVNEFTSRQLSGRNTPRNGLNRITGALARSVTFTAQALSDRIIGRVGFIEDRAAMIASVHELGTVGAGGSLPDIVPVHAKLLKFKTSTIVTSKKTGKSRRKWSDFIYARKVAIPPRLHFHETMRNAEVQDTIQRAASTALVEEVKRMADAAAKRAASKGGGDG